VHLYSGTSTGFVEDATLNQIGEKLSRAFFEHFRYEPPKSELMSWRNSLKSMASAVDVGRFDDHGVIVEYQLPLSSRRLDVMLTGRDHDGRSQGVIVELKQWDETFPTHVEDCVITFVGGARREVLHPSAQVSGYRQYLTDTHSAFSDGEVGLGACSYLHNMVFDSESELYADRHAGLLQVAPIFTGDQVHDLVEFLDVRIGEGGGVPILDTVLAGRYAPHKRLLDHTARMIRGEPTYVLLDEQRVAFNSVLAAVQQQHRTDTKSVFLINGGPGTGKSVIALNLVAGLSESGRVVHHATGSKAFTENVRKVVGRRAAAQFKYFNSYLGEEPEVLDVLVCDEAHRLREFSHNRFTPRARRTDRPQVEELIDAARVSVFFIDDLQVVRPGETGSSALIREAAGRFGAEVKEYELEAQFRCGGSDGFVQWVENTLGIRDTPHVLWEPEEQFEFDVVDSPWCYADLQAIVVPGLDGVMLPKVEGPEPLRALDWLLTQLERERGLDAGRIELLGLVETARGVERLAEIAAASPRLARLAFGVADYSLDLGLESTAGEAELAWIRSKLVHCSRVAGLAPPVDSVVVQVRDAERFRESARTGRSLGLRGKLCLHPDQVPIANEVFSPSAAEVARARAIVAAFEAAEAAGVAAIRVGDEFVDYPVVARARGVLAIADLNEATGRA